jgi:hypothetical protein
MRPKKRGSFRGRYGWPWSSSMLAAAVDKSDEEGQGEDDWYQGELQ